MDKQADQRSSPKEQLSLYYRVLRVVAIVVSVLLFLWIGIEFWYVVGPWTDLVLLCCGSVFFFIGVWSYRQAMAVAWGLVLDSVDDLVSSCWPSLYGLLVAFYGPGSIDRHSRCSCGSKSFHCGLYATHWTDMFSDERSCDLASTSTTAVN